jgi:hypothetical protein
MLPVKLIMRGVLNVVIEKILSDLLNFFNWVK